MVVLPACSSCAICSPRPSSAAWPVGSADEHALAGDSRLDADAWGGAQVGGRSGGQATGGGRAQDGVGQGVLAGRLDLGGQAEHLVGLVVAQGDDVGDLWDAAGQRAGLVEHHHAQAVQGFQVGAALDEDAGAGRAGDGGDHRDRHRDQQRARAGDHQHD